MWASFLQAIMSIAPGPVRIKACGCLKSLRIDLRLEDVFVLLEYFIVCVFNFKNLPMFFERGSYF